MNFHEKLLLVWFNVSTEKLRIGKSDTNCPFLMILIQQVNSLLAWITNGAWKWFFLVTVIKLYYLKIGFCSIPKGVNFIKPIISMQYYVWGALSNFHVKLLLVLFNVSTEKLRIGESDTNCSFLMILNQQVNSLLMQITNGA